MRDYKMRSTPWTLEVQERLRELYEGEKKSASMCAEQLNREFGTEFTRNAIMGRVARMKLSADGHQRNGVWGPKKVKPERLKKELTMKPPPEPEMAIPFPEEYKPDFTQITAAMSFTPSPEEEFMIALPISTRVTLMDLTPFSCRWPLEGPDGEEMLFCGEECDITKPYCEEHMALAFKPSQPKTKKLWRAYR